MDTIDFWSTKSKLYAILDANYMRGSITYAKEFELGPNQIVSLSISSKTGSPITLHEKFSTSNIDFKLDFRCGSSSGMPNWFRIDNQSNHNQLHQHLESGAQAFNHRVPLPETMSVVELISYSFEKAKETVSWKFPHIKILTGSSFAGTA